MSRVQWLLDRLRGRSVAEVIALARPTRVDEFLYALATPPDPAESPGLEIAHLRQGDRSGIPRIDSQLSGTRECYLARLHGHVCHESWLFRGSLLLGQFGLDGEAPLIGDCATIEDFRGKGIYPNVLRHISRQQLEAGAKVVYVLVAPENRASIRGIERAGFRRLVRLRGTRLAGLTLHKRREEFLG